MTRLPPFRNLDIYRLVVVRRLKQLDVAKSFSVDPSRISQVIRRVRNWVNDTIGDWLFPGRDDLRFYVALELEKIRVTELPDNPQTVTLSSPNRTYTRQIEAATVHQPDAQARANSASPSPTEIESADAPPPISGPQLNLNMSAQPINSIPAPNFDLLAATDFSTSDVLQFGARIAQLLILWKKHQKITAAIRPLRSTQTSTR
jgi:hypothetical protein